MGETIAKIFMDYIQQTSDVLAGWKSADMVANSRKRVRTFLRLIKALKLWGKTRWSEQVLIHVTIGTNLKTTDRLLRSTGAKCIGGGYMV